MTRTVNRVYSVGMENTEAKPQDLSIQELLDGMSDAVVNGDTTTFKKFQKELKRRHPITDEGT